MGDQAAEIQWGSFGSLETLTTCDIDAISNFDQDFIVVSTAFNLHTPFPSPYTDNPPDCILQTSDQILFHVHRERLQSKSRTSFGGLFTDSCAIALDGSSVVFLVDEDARVINCLLHILYGISSRIYSPDFETIAQTFDALVEYGCQLSECVPADSETFIDLMSYSADPNADPLAVYTLAASHGFEELAVQCSYYALRVPISSIDAQSSITMGPLYLARLFRLHEARKAALDKLLLNPPELHENASDCDWELRMSVMRAYSLVAGYITWEAKADTSPAWINSHFEMMMQSVGCHDCRKGVRVRVMGVVSAWDEVKKTI
ncbi:uncharacterized protein EI90DRAFT_3062686 [Cantharellus anzutake]|uniref:uncharacterized protein n=1 Tax=Cantharellus anzutake TaxID=1750568 RepID=UPI00190306D1|nr:uncharacterized protein EI90DRAFT_3062686 [Cantharellus anzutake]KAF8329457.1 hypothetical protein EI90DRAFT_3062686 [Cantharellus anzutake]